MQIVKIVFRIIERFKMSENKVVLKGGVSHNKFLIGDFFVDALERLSDIIDVTAKEINDLNVGFSVGDLNDIRNSRFGMQEAGRNLPLDTRGVTAKNSNGKKQYIPVPRQSQNLTNLNGYSTNVPYLKIANNNDDFIVGKKEKSKYKSFLDDEEAKNRKMKERADVLYGNDKQYYEKYPNDKYELYAQKAKVNNDSDFKNKQVNDISNPYNSIFKNGMLGDSFEVKNLNNLQLMNGTQSHKLLSADLNFFKAFASVVKKIYNSNKDKEIVFSDYAQYLLKNLTKEEFRFLLGLYMKAGPWASRVIGVFFGKEVRLILDISKPNVDLKKAAPESKAVYNHPDELSEEYKSAVLNKVKTQLGKTDVRGVLLPINSSASQSIKNSSEALTLVKKIKPLLKENPSKMYSTSLNFVSTVNLNYSFRKADIINIRYEDGKLKGTLLDTTDYNAGDKMKLVQAARELQLEGKIVPVFVLVEFEL